MSAAASKYQDYVGLKVKRAPREWTRQIVITNMWDDQDWADIQDDPEVEAAILDIYIGDMKDQEGRPGYENGPELLRDTFMIFLKTVPTLHKKKEVKKDARLNGKFIEKIMELDEYENLHEITHTDPIAAKDAMLLLCPAINEMIKEHREAVKEANDRKNDDQSGEGESSKGDSWDEETPGSKSQSNDPGQKGDGSSQQNQQNKPTENTGKSQDKKDADEESEKPDKGEGSEEQEKEEPQPQPEEWDDGDDEDGKSDQPEEAEGDGDEQDSQGGSGDTEDDNEPTDGEHGFDDDYMDKEYDEAESEQDQAWQDTVEKVDVGAAMNGALKDAADEMRAIEEARRGVGIEDGEWLLMDPKERKRIADMLRGNPKLREIAELVGRMKRFAQAQQATKIIDSPHEITSIEMGNDLRRVLRSEFAFLGHSLGKYEFYRKFVNGELLLHKERGHENAGRGPIVCLIDNSGSMSGGPENWAKGVAEALRRVCQDQGRDFYAIYFGANTHRERFDFPKGKASFDQILKFLSMTANWGTEFDGVLTEALQKCQTHFSEAEEAKADIVFITDGQAHLTDKWIKEFNAERKEIGIRVFGVYINAYDSSRKDACGILDRFCDFTLPVASLVIDDDATAKIFSTV
jgi:uncharacterized protein with von Willebrand factor type A (vWA) domain